MEHWNNTFHHLRHALNYLLVDATIYNQRGTIGKEMAEKTLLTAMQ